METRFIKPFIKSAGGILLAAGLLRLVIAAGNAPALLLADPVLGLSLRSAVLLVGGIELAVALICLFGQRSGFQISLLAWLMTNFMIYQAGAFSMHCHFQSSCLGSLTDPLHLARGSTGLMLQFIIPLCLLLGSYAALVCLWLDHRIVLSRQRAAQSVKMFCPACGGHIAFAVQNLGLKIPCPHCQKETVLRRNENLKMSCFFCKGHIEFPAHAIGEKMPCPHCKMDITLKEPA